MIKIYIERNSNFAICGFRAYQHGDAIVCSAVSILTFTAVNSIDAFTDEHIKLNYDEKGGLLEFELPAIKNGGNNLDCNLLLNAMMLGLKSIALNYPEHIRIFDKEV